MEINESREGSFAVLEFNGRLDSTTLKGMEQRIPKLIECGERRILLDFSHLDYINSAGLRVLIMAAKQMDSTGGGKILICSMKDYIREVFDISGFSTIFPIYPDREEAMRAFP